MAMAMDSFREFGGNDSFGTAAWKALSNVRNAAPLIQCITNFVSTDIMPNVLLAAGASPAMVDSMEEIAEIAALANALCVSVGTLSREWVASMKAAASRATELKKPWVLDTHAVGLEATKFRRDTCLELIALRPTAIQGNASEIVATVGACFGAIKLQEKNSPVTPVRPKDALEAAKELAKFSQSIVAVTGPSLLAFVTDGKHVLGVGNGADLVHRISETHSAVTALISAFVAVHPGRPLEACAFALAIFGLAGQIGTEKANGAASLRVHLLDALYCLDEASVISRIIIAQI